MPESSVAPRDVAEKLFGFRLDRDTRSPQLAMEAFLTLAANGYVDRDEDSLMTPKRGNLSLRSLAMGANFHSGSDKWTADGHLVAEVGESLSRGLDLPGFTNLDLAAESLAAVIDRETTRQADKGRWLLYPFHEALLWYDARPQRAAGTWSVRQVVMRGTGITVASMLSDPSLAESPAVLKGIREALTAPSRFALLHAALPEAEEEHRDAEENEKRDWIAGRGTEVRPISEALVRHCAAICAQQRLSPAARLWQLRAMFALDIAIGALRIAWERSETPLRQRYLLLSCQPLAERRRDFVRQYSEESWNAARRRLAEATVRTLSDLFAAQPADVEWESAIGIHREAQADRMKSVLTFSRTVLRAPTTRVPLSWPTRRWTTRAPPMGSVSCSRVWSSLQVRPPTATCGRARRSSPRSWGRSGMRCRCRFPTSRAASSRSGRCSSPSTTHPAPMPPNSSKAPTSS